LAAISDTITDTTVLQIKIGPEFIKKLAMPEGIVIENDIGRKKVQIVLTVPSDSIRDGLMDLLHSEGNKT